MRENTDHKKLRIWTLFTQWFIKRPLQLIVSLEADQLENEQQEPAMDNLDQNV